MLGAVHEQRLVVSRTANMERVGAKRMKDSRIKHNGSDDCVPVLRGQKVGSNSKKIHLFPGWDAASTAELKAAARNIAEYSPFEDFSLPVQTIGRLSGTSAGEGATRLPLFGSCQIASASHKQHWICNAGGPIWTIDWCPAKVSASVTEACKTDADDDEASTTRPAAVAQCAVIAAHGSKDRQSTKHRIGATTSGKNMLQIWKAPSHCMDAGASVQPQMLFGIGHEGGLAWDCKWCPEDGAAYPQTFDRNGRLGLLAAGLGDGTLVVYAVPDPCAVHSACVGIDPPVRRSICLALEPVFKCFVKGKILWCLAWSPTSDCRIMAGCTDGTVFIWDTASAAAAASGWGGTGRPPCCCCSSPLLTFAASINGSPLRKVFWAPVNVTGPDVVVTAGDDGAVKVWNLRDPWQPQFLLRGKARSWLFGVAWPPGIAALFHCNADGCLECYNFAQEQSFILINSGMAALWDISHSPVDPEMLALVTEDGYLRVLTNVGKVTMPQWDRRTKPVCAIKSWLGTSTLG
eukprot:SAG31_NODE_1_length_62978_cov_30.836130_1_plen_518_part_00